MMDKIAELKVYAHEFQDKLSSLIDFDGRVGAYDLQSFMKMEPLENASRYFYN